MKRHANGRGKALVPIEASTAQLIPTDKRNNLTGWFALYLGVEAEPGSATLEAKRRDLQLFLDFFRRTAGSDRPDLWTPAITKGFQKQLGKTRKATTVNRVLA